MYVNARAIIERETETGTDLLFQMSARPGFPSRLEFPGGRLEEYEPILTALEREIREETGLQVTVISDDPRRVVSADAEATVECVVPFCAYQTTAGPVDSVGFFFRCRAEGELTDRGDAAFGHRWLPVTEAERMLPQEPEAIDWLTRAALRFYLSHRGAPR